MRLFKSFDIASVTNDIKNFLLDLESKLKI